MATKLIPVILVAGFLGSGKTTLLNHLLANRDGARVGVVVNDFGSINVDAMAVAGQVDTMMAVGNGCLCCAVDASGLDAMLAKLSEAEAGIDVIVIEASGLAEPRDLIRLMIAGENPAIAYGGLVEVVDAAEFPATRARHPELDEHLRLADLVVLNKADRVDATTLAKLTGTVEELSPGTPVLTTTHGRVDPKLFFDPGPAKRAGQLSFDDLRAEDHDHSKHLHAKYESVEFTTDRPLHPRRLVRFLEQRPAGLYRIKGYLDFGPTGPLSRFGLHTVGAFVRFERTHWPSGGPRQTELVLIGAGIDAAAVRSRLGACVADDPGVVDERGLLHVLRYTEDRAARHAEDPETTQDEPSTTDTEEA
ncbi:CobW family GTP-binding protein [Amycolatopsis sp. H20-H5]|uniref:CobW family GTP-binding protein n=1 Tax=Amycolatopsis sp. H20-H5 TaxID=3046309 RepID=UPI002DB6B8ED|nr:GTP-binding protein [Amycolatopsis sp. H20-H5]MEC3976064.1 GTP-binding protein [Amycolatopsis sp. H20-H5]